MSPHKPLNYTGAMAISLARTDKHLAKRLPPNNSNLKTAFSEGRLTVLTGSALEVHLGTQHFFVFTLPNAKTKQTFRLYADEVSSISELGGKQLWPAHTP